MVWLAEEKQANACGENRFHIVVVSLWDSRVPRKGGSAVATREIRLAQREAGFRPFRFEARSFAQFAQTSVIFTRQKPAHVMFKRIETQWALAFRSEERRVRERV